MKKCLPRSEAWKGASTLAPNQHQNLARFSDQGQASVQVNPTRLVLVICLVVVFVAWMAVGLYEQWTTGNSPLLRDPATLALFVLMARLVPPQGKERA